MIKQNVQSILRQLPDDVLLVAAAKTKSADEIQEAIDAGVGIIGENYLQEAKSAQKLIKGSAKWHFIGHLQRNKVKKAVELFDMIQTVDSRQIAEAIDEASFKQNKVMPVLVEVNSGQEAQKFGVLPDKTGDFIKSVAHLEHIQVMGLMTMGPDTDNSDESRKYFRRTKQIFDQIKALKLNRVKMQYLSMGMTSSYQVAIEEGANMVRIGSKIFGQRDLN